MIAAIPRITYSHLYNAALAVRAGGVSIIPINHRTKQPSFNLLPKNEAGKAIWGVFQTRIATDKEIAEWQTAGFEAYAAVCGKISGGLLIIDFDEPRFYEAWLELVGALANDLPTQQTGRGYQVAVRTDD